MLSDHFNSKKGKNDNSDWHFNALVGVRFTIGKSHGKTEPQYERVTRMEEGMKVVVAKPEPPALTEEQMLRFKVNIQFVINRSDIRRNQMSKLNNLLSYLQQHPNAYVRLSGYADRETGNAQINMRLSRERSQAVSDWLQNQGIAESRIRRYAKGDTVQPFDLPEDNRVTTCYVYNPDEESGEWKLDN
jgi:outer membrane protein OmpA-like peptidoglycan-associated protein